MNDSRLSIRGTVCILLAALMPALTGCVTIDARASLNKYNTLYGTSQYREAGEVYAEKIKDTKRDRRNLLELLQTASALRSAGEYELSTALLDRAEAVIKDRNEELLHGKALRTAGTILVNDTVAPYKASIYDGIALNTYKALNYWHLGDSESARVEFNRAVDRQRRAKIDFSREVEKLRSDMEGEQRRADRVSRDRKAPHLDLSRSVDNPGIDRIISDRYSTLDSYKVYPDFVNPFTTYMAGLFFMSQRDYSKSAPLLKEAYGMMRGNAIVAEDLLHVESLLDMTSASPSKLREAAERRGKHVWVVLEGGLSPVKDSVKIELPLIVYPDRTYYAAIALPSLRLRGEPFGEVRIMDKRATLLGRAELLASMDRVVQSEFKKRFPMVLTRAVISATVKTYMQRVAQEEYGDFGNLAAILYQAATTTADTRSWSALPKEYYVGRVKVPEDGLLVIATGGRQIANIRVEDNKNSLIYVRMTRVDSVPSYDIITF